MVLRAREGEWPEKFPVDRRAVQDYKKAIKADGGSFLDRALDSQHSTLDVYL